MTCFEEMPYLTAKQIQLILDDLPEAVENGRSGKPACTSAMAAQVTYAITKVCRVKWWDQVGDCAGAPDIGANEAERHEDHCTGPRDILPQPVQTGLQGSRKSIR